MSDEWEEEEIMKSKKLWKSFEKQECTWVMSEKRKRRQEALIRLFTLLAWPPSSYFHIFQALFLWKQSHIFLTCRFASFVMDMLPLSFVTSFFEDQVAQFESTSFRQTKSKSHPCVPCKESDDFFLADHVTNSGQLSSRITNPVKCDGATDARILMDPSPAWCQFHIPRSWTSISSCKKAHFAGFSSCVCWWPSISFVANVNKAYYWGNIWGTDYEAEEYRWWQDFIFCRVSYVVSDIIWHGGPISDWNSNVIRTKRWGRICTSENS